MTQGPTYEIALEIEIMGRQSNLDFAFNKYLELKDALTKLKIELRALTTVEAF